MHRTSRKISIAWFQQIWFDGSPCSHKWIEGHYSGFQNFTNNVPHLGYYLLFQSMLWELTRGSWKTFFDKNSLHERNFWSSSQNVGVWQKWTPIRMCCLTLNNWLLLCSCRFRTSKLVCMIFQVAMIHDLSGRMLWIVCFVSIGTETVLLWDKIPVFNRIVPKKNLFIIISCPNSMQYSQPIGALKVWTRNRSVSPPFHNVFAKMLYFVIPSSERTPYPTLLVPHRDEYYKMDL